LSFTFVYMEAIFEFLVMTVLAVPGILIRWVLNLGKVPLKKLAEDDVWYNATYSVLLIITGLVIKQFVLKV